jgi:hypothetical protein
MLAQQTRERGSRNHLEGKGLTCYATGCWASSGYSVQGCAQLEQKLRQCMDAPVGSAITSGNNHNSDLYSATPTRRRTISITTSPECTRKSLDLTSGIKRILLVDRPLYIICVLSVQRPVRAINMRIGGVYELQLLGWRCMEA